MPPTTDDHRLTALAEQSAALISSLQTPEGAYPASPTFSAYVGYSWFRDGAFIADGMSSWGEAASAEQFFDWCARVLEARSDHLERIVEAALAGRPVPDEAMLPTRFTFDGREGDDEWWDFQLDGYGTWLWAVGEHVGRHGADPSRWRTAVELSVDYLVSSWDRPCYDWWEEHPMHRHGSTLGCIVAGLRAALGLGVLDETRASAATAAAAAAEARLKGEAVSDGHLAKWIGSSEVDASLAAVVGLLNVVGAGTDIGRRTIDAVEDDLTKDGGVHRYLDDTFYGGGQWPLLSCMLGLAHARAGSTARARELLDWAASTAATDGSMPEQVDRHLLAPTRVDEWVDRWGSVAQPLLWSHAMLIRLVVELGLRPDADVRRATSDARA
ncbi:glycoside hydrolase family 15 protein [Microbacterium sp. SD291]|uniref:glycoside hydrolase family 15 protein n=1 Tax=Microbacterium sp. SD291 TaxID=2782007 RepID=UPI001A97CF4F|nr:glycoside hydrolase family 15 protein [Microbacterium sp. SD291]MBO0981504.1 glycoside hydrolase family 15 [Microbacterium sp. SD291]